MLIVTRGSAAGCTRVSYRNRNSIFLAVPLSVVVIMIKPNRI